VELRRRTPCYRRDIGGCGGSSEPRWAVRKRPSLAPAATWSPDGRRWEKIRHAQNMEAAAMGALGGGPVVPGAVGAWRRAAVEQLGGYPADTRRTGPDPSRPAGGLAGGVDPGRDAAYTRRRRPSRAAETALSLVVRHPQLPLEAARRHVKPQGARVLARRPAADWSFRSFLGECRAPGGPGC